MPASTKKFNGLYRKPGSNRKKGKFDLVSPFWVNPKTGERSTSSRRGFEYVASQLEWDVWQLLERNGLYFKRQYELILLGDERWKIDFYLPLQKVGIECKGKWILEADSEKQRCLKLQALIAESKGHRIIFANTSPFSFRDTDVISTKELIDVINQ
jgi:hypothetical protein